jgi:glycosyltransferase involved in cell wall biosynthesis
MPKRTTAPLFVHLIPSFGLGGVERAAETIRLLDRNVLNICVLPVFSSNSPSSRLIIFFRIRSLFFIFIRLIQLKPKVLIVSLWWCCIIGITYKLFRPKLRLVTFIHLSVDSHLHDFFLTRISCFLSSEIWADSLASKEARLPRVLARRARVISFLLDHHTPNPYFKVSPSFIFWGRLHPQKNLERALIFFKKVKSCFFPQQVKFTIVGPDQGELSKLKFLCESYSIVNDVQFVGPKTFDEIRLIARESSFYLQTSVAEGMGVSVVEAMQLGLIPLVSAVGEFSNYILHGTNGVFLSDDDEGLRALKSFLSDENEYLRVRRNAIATWSGVATYRESVRDACMNLFP